MRRTFSVEVDKWNPMDLVETLKKLGEGIADFEYEWGISANGGGIEYGVFLNIDVDKKRIEISNQPNGDGEDLVEDVLECFDEDGEIIDEDDEEE